MCVQGYYASKEGNKTMPVQVESRLDNEHIEVLVGIERRSLRKSRKRFLHTLNKSVKLKLVLKESIIIFEAKFYVLESVE